MRIYFLRPTGPINADGGALDGCLARSDTLSAALVSVWRHVAPDTDIAGLAANPPFVVSSALPWTTIGGKDRALFLPVPPGLMDKVSSDDPKSRKQIKKIAYMTTEAIKSFLGSSYPDLKSLLSMDGGVLLTHLPPHDHRVTKNYRSFGSRLRVSVDRLGDGPIEGLLFETAASGFSKGSGFAVIAETEPESEKTFEAALRLLGLEGLGADRTCGQGGFAIEAIDRFVPPDLGKGLRLLLSVYHPTHQEVEEGVLDKGAYTILERGGWVTAPGASTLRRKTIRVLSEGSVVADVGGNTMGDVVLALDNVASFSVYRDGRALWVPIGENGVGHA